MRGDTDDSAVTVPVAVNPMPISTFLLFIHFRPLAHGGPRPNAIARCVANALIYGSKTIARYPLREAVGLVDI